MNDSRWEMASIDYGKRKISFTVTRKAVKNINLRVNPNLEVLVSANDSVPLDYIKAFVRLKAKWIDKRLDYYEKTKAIKQGEKDYVSGEAFRYLGRQYRLKVFKADDEKVKYYRGYIHLYIKDLNDFRRKEALIEKWYQERARIIFNDSLDRMVHLGRSYRIDYPQLASRKMTSRWGSCYPESNKIILNESLIKAPKDCIDYVVLHELIHFKYQNHSNDFYRLLTILMPDWQEKKKILDEVVVREL